MGTDESEKLPENPLAIEDQNELGAAVEVEELEERLEFASAACTCSFTLPF
jgi:hypothetical protein